MTDELLTVKDVAAMTRLSESTLYSRRALQLQPASFKLGGKVVYRRSVVEAWLAAQEQAEAERAAS